MKTFLFAGTYTQKSQSDHREEGVFAFDFDAVDGKLTLRSASRAGHNPSFLRIHPNKEFVYAVNELGAGEISAFRIDSETGGLSLINSRPTRGAHPCYVSFDPTGKYVLVSNYSSGSLAVFPIAANGEIGEMSGFIEHGGSGPDGKRQERPHAHSIAFDLSGRYVLAADLGIDRVLVYRLDPSTGKLVLNNLWGAAMRPGAGPRHFACHPNGRVIYVANELDSTVTACTWDSATGSLTPFQNLSTLPVNFEGENTVADIHIHPNGEVVYVSNRGDNSLAVFRIGIGGELDKIGIVSCGGNWPRNFTVDSSGRWLLCANQYSDQISLFRIADDGMLQESGGSTVVPSPVCLEWVTFDA